MEAKKAFAYPDEVAADITPIMLKLTRDDIELFKKAAEEIRLHYYSDSGIRSEFSPMLDAIINEAEK